MTSNILIKKGLLYLSFSYTEKYVVIKIIKFKVWHSF